MDDNLSATDFVGLCSTINVNMHTKFAKACKEQNKEYDESIGPAMPMLLITHALRHGLMEGSTVTDILTLASARSDRRIILKFPYRPVCPAFRASEDGGTDRWLLDKAALTCQALESLKKMGLVSNILTRVYVHALGGGHAKDVAHLEATSRQGLVTNEVRQSLGHTERSYRNGTTQKYVEDPTQLLYNDRVQNQWVDPLAPQFGSTSAHAVVKAPISATKVNA